MKSKNCLFHGFLAELSGEVFFGRKLGSVALKSFARQAHGLNAYGMLAYFYFSLAQCDLVIVNRVREQLYLLL